MTPWLFKSLSAIVVYIDDADLDQDSQIFNPHLRTDIYVERPTIVTSICCNLRPILIVIMLQKVCTATEICIMMMSLISA